MNTKRFQIKSIQFKITLWSGICLFLLAAILVGYAGATSRLQGIQLATEKAAAMAESEAAVIMAEIDVALDAARTLAHAFEATKNSDISLSRDEVNAMLKQVLDENPGFVGTYTLWEPNAFDGMDAKYGSREGHDETGRFIPYWSRDVDGNIMVEPLVDYEHAGPGDYYQVPKNTKMEAIIDPYIYPVQGKEVLITSLVVPIMIEGQFYGIAGVDLRLEFLQELVDEENAFDGTAKLVLISNNGTLSAVTGQPELIGEQATAIHTGFDENNTIVQNGEQLIQDMEDDLAVFVPIHFGFSPTPWSLNLLVPMKQITAEATIRMWKMVGIGSGLTLVALVLLWFAAGGVAKPIRHITDNAQEIAQGNLNQVVEISQADEVGQLAEAFRGMIAYLQNMADVAEQITAGDLSTDITLQSDADILGKAFANMIANLRDLMGRVLVNAKSVSVASSQLSSAAEQAGAATNQITATIQQVAQGTAQQSNSVNETANSIDQMARAFEGVAKGAQEQASAVVQSSQFTAQMSSAIQQVAANAQAGAKGANSAAETAKSGANIVESNLEGMQSIKETVGLSSKKVEEMGNRSNQIGVIVETIDDIAS